MRRTPEELRLRLSPSQVAPVRKWLRTFRKQEPYWAEHPKLRGQSLQISALAFPFLLAYADQKDSNEFDIFRLKRQGRQAIQTAIETDSPRRTRYYMHALKNLDAFSIGEFLTASRPNASSALN